MSEAKATDPDVLQVPYLLARYLHLTTLVTMFVLMIGNSVVQCLMPIALRISTTPMGRSPPASAAASCSGLGAFDPCKVYAKRM